MLVPALKIKGALQSPAVKEVLNKEPQADMKSKNRYFIQEQVFDNADSIADNAKMISLLISLVSRMYSTYTDTQKARLAQEDRDLIEYTFQKFSETTTRADVQFAEEGAGLIDKLLDRQAQIGEILS